jgi:hypothetical protein
LLTVLIGVVTELSSLSCLICEIASTADDEGPQLQRLSRAADRQRLAHRGAEVAESLEPGELREIVGRITACATRVGELVGAKAHHDLHEGHKTVRLRDGRYLNDHGFTEAPALHHVLPC